MATILHAARPSGNIVAFPSIRRAPKPAADPAAVFRGYTRALVLAKAASGELAPGILEALLDVAGVVAP